MLLLCVAAIPIALGARAVAVPTAVAVDDARIPLTVPGLVQGVRGAIEGEDLEGYEIALGESLQAELAGTSPRAFLRFLKSPAGRLASLQWTLLSRLGPGSLRELSGLRLDEAWTLPERRASLEWILTDEDILGAFLGSGDIDAGSWGEALQVFCRILDADLEGLVREGGLPRRLAIATALTWASPVTWMADGSEIDPVGRWKSYLDWDADGLLYATFRDLSTWELRYVVGSWSSDEDLVWARANIKDELRRRDKVGDGAHMLSYNLVNKDGVSVHEGRRFYDDKPMTLAIMLEYGGVCGAISRFGTSMSQAFGVPAMPVGQPGHCAFLWQKEPHRWSINNDISGWAESGRHSGIQMVWSDLAGSRAWLVPLMQEAQSDADAFLAAEILVQMSRLVEGDDRVDFLRDATERCPRHFEAWCRLAEAVAENSDGRRGQRDAQRVMRDAAKALGAHPTAFAVVADRLDEALVPADADRRERDRFVRDMGKQFALMARQGADAGLVSWGLRDILSRQCARLAPEHARAARALAEGGRGGDLTDREAELLFDLCFAATLELDVAVNGGPHAAWRKATERLVDGTVQQSALHQHGLVEFQKLVRRLAKTGRVDDARWLADRIVKSTGEHGDADLQAKAQALRGELG